MDFIIVSGISGSGKSIALHALEDLGYYCIDNLPAVLLPQLSDYLGQNTEGLSDRAAVSIDSRNRQFLQAVPSSLGHLRNAGLDVRIVFLISDDETLVRRYSETRRRHPLTNDTTTLIDGIIEERRLLSPLEQDADRRIDTTSTSPYELRAMIRQFVSGQHQNGTNLVFKSFGFKHGTPSDADYIFDVRCLPNPYWETELRDMTGLDKTVIDFLETEDSARELVNQISGFLEHWLPHYDEETRSYLTVALGCTGGQHRSVYVAQRLAEHFQYRDAPVQVAHRDLNMNSLPT